MTRADNRRRRRGAARLTAGATAVAVLGGAWLVNDGLTTSHPPEPTTAGAPPMAAPDAAPTAPGTPAPAAAPPLASSTPVRMRIPSIAVDATFTPLGLDSTGHLDTPPTDRRNLVGWYRDAATPGAAGTAVVVGHVDDKHGPGVLYRLGLLRPGLTLTITRQDRSTATFTVDAVRAYPKADFPTDTVYGSTDRAELRIITCGGHYDRRTGYDSNTVVFAHLTR